VGFSPLQIGPRVQGGGILTDGMVRGILMRGPNLSNKRPIQWGITHEEKAIEDYSALVGHIVHPCGTYLHPSGGLGATPDRIRDDGILVEVKCPYSGRRLDIKDIVKLSPKLKPDPFPFLELNGDNLSLKKLHPYYAQVPTIYV
jgi:hypothetical protein